ncbi:hypothetical protein [Streptomyces malaysiensis]|nr:hypothetical protein [Streptomyces malaysiensis]
MTDRDRAAPAADGAGQGSVGKSGITPGSRPELTERAAAAAHHTR